MPDASLARLLAFARRLQAATTLPALLLVARDETRQVVGYDRVWFMVADEDDPDELKLVEFSGQESESVWNVAATLSARSDSFIQAVLSSDEPVVVEDARTDPRTDKRIVEYLQNRTIIKIPIRLLDRPWGLIGMGTFGDEGCRPPTPEQLGYLVGMAGQLAVALSRLRFVETEKRVASERLELERRVQRLQKFESLGTLAGGIAHDFNNLLTVITAGARLAELDVKNEDALDNIRAVLQAAQRGTALTRQLLAMSRSQPLALRRIDLNEQLTQLLGLVKRILPASITIEFVPSPILPTIEGDASQLDQVFMNLAINARDAMPDGGRLIVETKAVTMAPDHADLQPWVKPGAYALVTLTDTGVGMSKEVLDRAFEPFFTTKEARAGTGLGLAVTYGIVQQHGGVLNVYSEPGLGTTFNAYFPAATREFEATEAPTVAEIPQAARGNECVLLADDDEFVRELARRILERAGYRVITAVDGASVCAAVHEAEFDIALIDVVMPGVPCNLLLERLRQLAPGLPTVLSSGYSAGLSIAELTRVTGNELLRKPYTPDELLSAVRAGIDRRAR
jgi:signal transduction histidine kinase/ActR/RegA family two-component response regulator